MLPEGALRGRVVLVTGGGSGLGRAMAIELGRLGAKVAVVGRRPEPLEDTVASLAGEGFAVQADVRDPAAVAAAFDVTVKVARTNISGARCGGRPICQASLRDGLLIVTGFAFHGPASHIVLFDRHGMEE